MEKVKEIFLKLQLLTLLLCCGLLLSGCENESNRDEKAEQNLFGGVHTEEEVNKDFAGSGIEEYASNSVENAEEDQENTDSLSEDAAESSGNTAEQKTFQKEMLVYRGSLMIDTLDFEQSVDKFKKLLDKADGFVETETYSDDGALNDYYIVEDEEKHNSYVATVRVPSREYDTIMNTAGKLGDLRGKSSHAENVTQQYGTYQSELEVYQTEYKRYMKLLRDATEDKLALKIQEKLFNLQVKIADLKSNITNLETDVAYSYIDITIREVKEYQEKPVKKDTFWQRLKNTCIDSWAGFLNMLEGLLFLLIRTWYYIVIIAVISWRVYRYGKKKSHQNRASEKSGNKS